MKKTFLFLSVLLFLTSIIFAKGNKEKADTSLENVQKRGVFILGLDDSFPPMGYRNDDNEIVGFDIDLAKEVCSSLGVTLKCQPIDWSSKEQELATGQIDCIWNGFTKTEERERNMTLSFPYLDNAQVIVVKNNSSYKTINDLKGKRLGVQGGSSGEEALENTPELNNNAKEVISYKDYLTALMDLEIGGVDAIIMDLLVANDNISRSGKDFRILDERLCEEEYVIGFKKGNVSLKDAVEKELLRLKEDEKLKEIAISWFGEDITKYTQSYYDHRSNTPHTL